MRNSSERKRRVVLQWLLLMIMFLTLSGCQKPGADSDGLLFGLEPLKVRGVTRSAVLNDGEVPPLGSRWNSSRTAVFSGRKSQVVWDLGEKKSIQAAAILADNNDTYRISISSDGKDFEEIWSAKPVSKSGLRWRKTTEIDREGRYIQLSPARGDSSLSVAELALYSEIPAELPPKLVINRSLDSSLGYRNALLNFLALALIVIALATSELGWWSRILLSLLGLYGLYGVGLTLWNAYPLEKHDVSLTRLVTAMLALGVVLREGLLSRKIRPVWSGFNVAALVIAGVLSLASFYNLGRPQFRDQREGEPSYVHSYDLRVYYPAAKYYDELKYDGVYWASVAAFAEEKGGIDSRLLKKTKLRDLRDHRMRKVPEVKDEILQVKERFTPERWAQLKEDMRYFWETMGNRAYLGSLRDHGGNATPLWLSIAHLLWSSFPASNQLLLWTGLLDPLLLLLFLVVATRTFGIRTALVSLVIFGANDFYMFGSNWGGATLRNDWMVYLGLGVCALKAERYRLGGAMLALSALIRAFPAMTLLALGLPLLHYIFDYRFSEKKWPTLRSIYDEQRWFFQTAAGATLMVIFAVAFSSLVLGFDSWALWVKKISSFTSSAHVNHISWLTVAVGSEGNQKFVLGQRVLLYSTGVALFVLLAFWAAWRKKPHQVALLGLALMPIFLYPANYYLHSVFLLALLVGEPLRGASAELRRQSLRVWSSLLILCALLFLTVREQALDIHFYNASVYLMGAL
ncbi:MAG: hypothetical protein MK135_12760, partial [Polyangiaceae bacterium]|nr:hypothetical protein [Polyangiaceae bacterium]